MNKREKAAREALAAKRYDNGDGSKTAFHVTKKGGEDVDNATWGSSKKRIALPRLSDFKRGKQ